MKNNFWLITALACVLLLGSCGKSGGGSGEGTDSTGKGKQASETVVRFEKNGLTVYSIEDSPQYSNASLTLDSPEPGAALPEGKNKFQFKANNYELGIQTPDASAKGLLNSKDGQHIHFILNNEPYHAHYGDLVESELKTGNYVMLAFLSRSYHESVKNNKAFVLRQFIVGTPVDMIKEADLNAPHLFYSRPKGEMYGADTKKVLLDFYLVNCDLSADGYKVKADINGTEFLFTKWAPYIIEGLPMGETKIKLELIDAGGNTVKSPFNPVERSVTLGETKPETPKEPMKM